MDLVCLYFLAVSKVVFQLKTHGTCKQHTNITVRYIVL